MVYIKQIVELVKAGDDQALTSLVHGQEIGEREGFFSKTIDIVKKVLHTLNASYGVESDSVRRAGQVRCLRHLLVKYPMTVHDLAAPYGDNLLEAALCTGRADIVQLIVDVNPELSVERGLTLEAIGKAVEAPAILECLLAKQGLRLKGFYGEKDALLPLVAGFAIHEDNVEAVRYLIGKGVDLRAPLPLHRFHHYTMCRDASAGEALALHFAKSIAMVEFLESQGCVLNTSDPAVNSGENAMYAALRRQELAHVRYLLARGLSVAHRDKHGNTPLHCAASSSATHKEVKLLLEAGAEVNARNEHGWTPLLHLVSRNMNKAKFAALVQAGADLFAKSNQGESILLKLRETGVIEVATQAILEACRDGRTLDAGMVSDFACRVVRSKLAKCATQLLACPVYDFRQRGATDSTVLHEAVTVFKEKVGIELLLEIAQKKGFDLESRNERGYTVLMEAIVAKNRAAIDLLLDAGADIYATTPKGVAAHSLTRDPATKAYLRSILTTDIVGEAVDAGLENGASGDTLEETTNKPAKRTLGLL